jgi:uncharacterized peroxidase-related enzyme
MSATERFPDAELTNLPEDIRARILATQERLGFVPAVLLKFARRPDEFRAFFAMNDALIERQSGLTMAEKLMIVVTTSAANQCIYCAVSHGSLLRVFQQDPLIADQLALNYRKAQITPRQRAMLDFALKITTASHEVCESDFETLQSHDFSNEDIWDISAITSMFAYANRMANLTGIMPNAQFYAIGRTAPATQG